MDIVPNINKDNLSKERIEFLKKQIENKVSIGLDKKPHTKRNVVREKDCFYDFALNTKNFIKHLIRYGLIEKKEDVIVAKKTNM